MLNKKWIFLICLALVVYMIDSRTEVPILEDTSVPVGMEIPAKKKTFEEFVGIAKNIDPLYPIGLPYTKYPDLVLPTYIKYRENLLTNVVDQGKCASCWAISVCHMIQDRISLYTGGKIKRPLSYQELVSCFNVKGDLGCTEGGSPEQAYDYIASNGIASAQDYPYQQFKTTDIVKCDPLKKQGLRTYIQRNSVRSLCIDPSIYKKGSNKWQSVINQNMRNMCTELFLNGPIVTTIQVFSSIYNFDGLSIYDPDEKDLGKYIGGHAVVCLGAVMDEVNGEEPGFDGKYYIIKNSWSASHPIKSPASKGFFYIRAGKNVCGIESRASTCQISMTDEIKGNMVASLDESRYLTYESYVSDPERQLFITKSTRLRSMLRS